MIWNSLCSPDYQSQTWGDSPVAVSSGTIIGTRYKTETASRSKLFLVEWYTWLLKYFTIWHGCMYLHRPTIPSVGYSTVSEEMAHTEWALVCFNTQFLLWNSTQMWWRLKNDLIYALVKMRINWSITIGKHPFKKTLCISLGSKDF